MEGVGALLQGGEEEEGALVPEEVRVSSLPSLTVVLHYIIIMTD